MLLLLLALGYFLVACSASTAPVVKIGLVAPFEGRYRVIGYEAIYAARLAVREINAVGGVGGYRVELFALDDGGDPGLALEQARKLAVDPQVVAVIGHFRAETTDAALDAYCAERLPLLAVALTRASLCPDVYALTPPQANEPVADPSAFVFSATVPDPNDFAEAAAFVAAYNAIPIDGTLAGPIALQTYDAMHLIFDALARDIQAAGAPSRAGVARALSDADFEALGGRYRFDAERDRIGAELRMYRYSVDRRPELIQ